MTHEISRDAHKLTETPMLIKKKRKKKEAKAGSLISPTVL